MFVHLPHCPGELKSVHLGHHDVGNNEVVQAVVQLVVGVAGPQAAFRLKAAVVEIGAHQLAKFRVVLQDQNMDHTRFLLTVVSAFCWRRSS